MRRISIIAALIMFSCSIFSQAQIDPFEVNNRLGRGINLGNTFEAPSEGAWGVPWKEEYFKTIADLGFSHVRIPVRWETPERSLETYPYTISTEFFQRIQTVVDSALDHGLMVIINMHHHDALFDDPQEDKARFLSQWNQIAGFFKEYPSDLLFEVLNEPHGSLTSMLWNEFFEDALQIIRITNPRRTVLMGTAEYGGLGAISDLVLPEDDNIILTIHYYNPFQFTHQGAGWSGIEAQTWLGTKWFGTAAERETVKSEFVQAERFSKENNIPIHIGEFGAYEQADMESRVRWTTFLARWFEEQGFSWAYWEFNAGFGIYDPASDTLRQPLIDALLNNPIPEVHSFETAVPVYTSEFEKSKNGWRLGLQQGAVGALLNKNSSLEVMLVNGGTEGWHAQLSKPGIVLEKDKMYRLSVIAGSESDWSITVYAGKASSPWSSYSGYTAKQFSGERETAAITWTMKAPTDRRSRIVMDLGTNSGTLRIIEVKLEEIEITD